MPNMIKKILLISLLLLILFTLKAGAGLTVNSKLVHKFETSADEKMMREIVLKNNTKHEIMVRLYKRDYSFNSKGENFYRSPGFNSRSNAKWILLPERTLSISPFAKESVKYIINVPNKTLKGTYWCMVMVEEYDSQIKNGNKIIDSRFTHKVRYGIQIVTNFGQKGNVQIGYRNPKIEKESEKEYIFGIDIINKGIFELKMRPQIIVVNEDTGEIMNKYKKKQVRLYPNTSTAVKEKIILHKNISYKVIVIVGNNRRGYHGKEYSIGVVSD